MICFVFFSCFCWMAPKSFFFYLSQINRHILFMTINLNQIFVHLLIFIFIFMVFFRWNSFKFTCTQMYLNKMVGLLMSKLLKFLLEWGIFSIHTVKKVLRIKQTRILLFFCVCFVLREVLFDGNRLEEC